MIKKYIRPLFLVLFNNTFLLMFMYMLNDFAYWGILCTLVIGLGWFISFSMLVVGVRYTKVPKDIEKCLGMEKVLSSERIKDKNNTVNLEFSGGIKMASIKDFIEENAVNEGFLQDWYQSSVLDTDTPVWTDEHISEVCGDFYLIPKEVVNKM